MLRVSLCALHLIRQTPTDRALHSLALRPYEAKGYCPARPKHSYAEHPMMVISRHLKRQTVKSAMEIE